MTKSSVKKSANSLVSLSKIRKVKPRKQEILPSTENSNSGAASVRASFQVKGGCVPLGGE